MARKPSERSRIVNQPDKRPWGAAISCVLTDDQLGFDGESCLLLHDDHVVELAASPIDGNDPAHGQRIKVAVSGFASACEAEAAGLKIAGALLWLAVAIRCPLRLEYNTPQPSIVFDRRDRNRVLLTDKVSVQVTRGADRATKAMRTVYGLDSPFDLKLLTSLELFASARLELTERTRFLGLVSALEPIAEQRIYRDELEELTRDLLDVVSQRTDIPEEILPSIQGQIRNLKRESVRQAIRRLVTTHLTAEESDVVDVAYNARSSLVHDGRSDEDLSELSTQLEEILRRLYASITGLSLQV